MNDRLLQQIRQLPPLPESAIKIEAVYQNPNSTFNDMVKILEKDPLLTADILKAANSPLYGFSREINAISQAVGLFGMGTVRGFALASIVKKSFPLDLSSYGITNAQFAELSSKQHAIVTSWYIRKDPKLLGTLSPAAFLVEIGKVLISQYIIEEKAQEKFRDALKNIGNVESAEIEIVGVHAPEVSATIFTHWKFEEKLIETIRHCVEPENASDDIKKAAQSLHVVRVAVPINGVLTEASIEEAKQLVSKYGLDMESFTKAIETVLA
ncbi:HDOD domain-containing protein [bacterium]|nr:HDOD domain-containing protein [bacterium]MBU1883850.1 HDOD domain-containing protein [bacterium]